MKTVRWTVFIGGTLAGGSPNKKPATKSPEAGGVWGTPQGCPTEPSEARLEMPPLPLGRGGWG